MDDDSKYILKSIRWLLFCVLVILSIMCARTAYADTPAQGDYGPAWSAEKAASYVSAPVFPPAQQRVSAPATAPQKASIPETITIGGYLPWGADMWADLERIASETSASVEATATR